MLWLDGGIMKKPCDNINRIIAVDKYIRHFSSLITANSDQYNIEILSILWNQPGMKKYMANPYETRAYKNLMRNRIKIN